MQLGVSHVAQINSASPYCHSCLYVLAPSLESDLVLKIWHMGPYSPLEVCGLELSNQRCGESYGTSFIASLPLLAVSIRPSSGCRCQEDRVWDYSLICEILLALS